MPVSTLSKVPNAQWRIVSKLKSEEVDFLLESFTKIKASGYAW